MQRNRELGSYQMQWGMLIPWRDIVKALRLDLFWNSKWFTLRVVREQNPVWPMDYVLQMLELREWHSAAGARFQLALLPLKFSFSLF